MRLLSELIDKKRKIILKEDSFILLFEDKRPEGFVGFTAKRCRINILALGDVGGTVLLGLRLLGGDVVESIGIYDINPAFQRRYEREINQVNYPDGRKLPTVEIIDEDELFSCDVFVFCASRGVPPVGAQGDVRMAQLEANKELVSAYASKAVKKDFKGLFAVVSDPVDPLCKSAVRCGLDETSVIGYGLGVMNGRARYFAEHDNRFGMYLKEGRAFGPHGEDLVIANSISDYSEQLSYELTEMTVNSNRVTRADGFKPYIAPAMSSGALSLLATINGNWNYSSVFFGNRDRGAFMGCRNRMTDAGIQVENMPLDDKLFTRIKKAYINLEKL
ncbi:MAG: lactate dehydrogenase [Bacillota bacterium]|nr:lactate dehydrogenase [Bacillota bacterium]